MAESTHEQLIEVLCQLGDRGMAEKHAVHIHAAILSAARGHDIGKGKTGYCARPRRDKSRGPAKEFRDLTSLARKAIRGKMSREDWARAWVARATPAVWSACRPFLLERGRRSLDRTKLISFSAPKFTTAIPKPEAALPALELAAERGRLATGNKKERKPDQAALDVIAAVRSAYTALTGYRGGRAFLAGGLPGRFLRLGHEIDRLFGTHFFPRSSDSSRLRQSDSRRKQQK